MSDFDRLGLHQHCELSEEQQELYEAYAKYTESKYAGIFKARDDSGRFLGPFGILLQTPEVAKAYLPMIAAISKISNLDKDVRETAILVVGARTGARYETYAHEPVSGFSQADCAAILEGRCPDTFSRKQEIAFHLATALTRGFGPLSEDLWRQALEGLGKDQAISLIHYIGFYSYVAVLLNGFNASVPA